MLRRRWWMLLVLVLAICSVPGLAQGQYRTVNGRLQIIWGEIERGKGQEQYLLYAQDGFTYQLDLSETQKAQLGYESGTQIEVEISNASTENSQTTVNQVLSSREATNVQSAKPSAIPNSPRRYLNVLCADPNAKKFPHDSVWYENLIVAESRFWNRTAGVTFESVTVDWSFLSKPISSFLTTDISGTVVPLFQPLSDACIKAAGNKISNPSSFDGINFFFSQDIGCCAWGGGIELTIRGVRKGYAATWMPPWDWILAGLAHELGHSIGLPHSAGPGGLAYGSRFDLMSDLWTDCPRAMDPVYGCMPQGTAYGQLQKLAAIDPSRFIRINTAQKGYFTVFLGALYRPPSELPPEYVYGVTLDEAQYGDKFGLTIEYRDNRIVGSYDQKLAVRGVVIHERNQFGRPDPLHLLVSGRGTANQVWAVGTKLTYSFATVCVARETTFGVEILIGVSGADCINPPKGKAEGYVNYNILLVFTEDIDPQTLPTSISVGVYRKESPSDTLVATVTMLANPNQQTVFLADWNNCDKAGEYVMKGTVAGVPITSQLFHINCSRKLLPMIRK